MVRASKVFSIVVLTVLLGCSSSPRGSNEGDTVTQIIAACSAGVTSGHAESVALTGAFFDALKNGKIEVKGSTGLDDWMHGYIFDHLPVDQRVKAYGEYLACRKDMTAALNAYIDPPLVPLKEHSQTLWNEYAEAVRLRNKIPVSRAVVYRTMGDALHALDSAELNLKSEIMRRDRETLMYNISAAILADATYLTPEERTAAIRDTVAAVHASQLASEALSKLLHSSSVVAFGEWVSRQNVEVGIHSRLADAFALQYYLSGAEKSFTQLENALESLPCDYISNEKMREDPLYARLKPTPSTLRRCGRESRASIGFP